VGRIIPQTDDAQAELMDDAGEILGQSGIFRYEVSNYARRGFESRHNLNYWRGGDYLACGNGAHGHRNGHRWWNERAASRYISLINAQGSARAGEEHLSSRERLEEIVLTGLRLREGFSLDEASRRLNLNAKRVLEQGSAWRVLTEQGLLREDNGNLFLSPPALALADAIAVRLLS
jgi:oxygen-independent coproporphyrinogen-3 oxidase